MRPTARQEDILTSEFEDELIVYDMQNHKAHNLNRAAAAVWRLCDGRRTVADIAAALRRSNLPAADEDFVWLALRRLGRARLLLNAPARPPRPAPTSRRRMLRRLGAAGVGALVLPLVTSIVVPTPAMAQSLVFQICGDVPFTLTSITAFGCTAQQVRLATANELCGNLCAGAGPCAPHESCRPNGLAGIISDPIVVEPVQLADCPGGQGVQVIFPNVKGCDCTCAPSPVDV